MPLVPLAPPAFRAIGVSDDEQTLFMLPPKPVKVPIVPFSAVRAFAYKEHYTSLLVPPNHIQCF